MRAWVIGGLMVCSLAAAMAQQQPGGAAGKQGNSASQTQRPASAAMETRGEQKFQQNCSRCHHAPQELSPRISGTVVMHMRVRASLSERDAKAILQYLAP